MKIAFRLVCLVTLLSLTTLMMAQQGKKAGVVDRAELKSLVPTTYFYSGQVAPVQMRNSLAIRTGGGKLVIAGLVDTSGYSSETTQKYQGFFITETKLSIGDATINPGQYGFGFSDGKFYIMDVGGNEVASVTSQQDEALKRPTPLQATADGENYRLYAGKKYVVIKAQ